MRLMTFNLGLFRLTPLDLSPASYLPLIEDSINGLRDKPAPAGGGIGGFAQKLLRTIGGLWLWPISEPATYIEARLAQMSAFFREQQPDILCVQEIYTRPHQNMLIRQLRDMYPYFARNETRNHFGVSDGMLILSRWPLDNINFEAFTDGLAIEDLVGQKGILSADVTPPDMGPMRVFNIHCTAGAFIREQTDPEVESIRGKQIDHILSRADKVMGATPLICGDFNMGPDVSRGNYDDLISAGYSDLYAEVVKEQKGVMKPSWGGKNALVNGGPDMHIDLVLLPTRKLRHFVLEKADVTGQENRVDLPNGKSVPLSDHYPVTIEVKRA